MKFTIFLRQARGVFLKQMRQHTSTFNIRQNPFWSPKCQNRTVWFNIHPTSEQSRASWWIRRILRVIPIGFITFTVFRTGYAMGLADYAVDPVAMDKALMDGIIGSRVDSSDEASLYLDCNSKEYKRIQKVSIRVLTVARQLANQKVLEYRGKQASRVIDNSDRLEIRNDSNEVVKVLSLSDELERWEKATKKLSGDWKIIVINDPSPNAFVTDVCPKRIFVNVGLLQAMDPTDDELAMVISHELSHVILGHNTSTLEKQLFSLLIQLIYISFVDPFGILTLLLDYFSFQLTALYTAFHSRAMETEADVLGMEMLARACYNVENGPNVFRKLEEYADKGQESSWFHTHPPSKHRYETLGELSKKYAILFSSGECQRWRREFDKAVAALSSDTESTFPISFGFPFSQNSKSK